MESGDFNNTSGLMSDVENRKTRSSSIFQVENETLPQATAPRLPPEYLGIPLVDYDLPGDEVRIILARIRNQFRRSYEPSLKILLLSLYLTRIYPCHRSRVLSRAMWGLGICSPGGMPARLYNPTNCVLIKFGGLVSKSLLLFLRLCDLKVNHMVL